MIPKIKVDTAGKVYVEGDFEFQNSNIFLTPDQKETYLEISFKWNPESPADGCGLSNKQLGELIGEKLKRDFVEYYKNCVNLFAERVFKCSPVDLWEQIYNYIDIKNKLGFGQ